MREGCVEIVMETNKHMALRLGIGNTKVYCTAPIADISIDF